MQNKGEAFEELIEWTNITYAIKEQAIIQKIATPWKIERRFNPLTQKREIISAYPLEKSTVDFGGTAKGNSIWFDAKTTQNKTSFPLANIKPHQIEFLRRVHEQGGKGFFLIYSEALNITWLLWILDLLSFMEQNERKSLTFAWLNENCPVIKSTKGVAVDYLSEVIEC